MRDRTFFAECFDRVSKHIHAIAKSKGFWGKGSAGVEQRNDGELIALMHSELSEALESVREGYPRDEKLPEFDSVTVELADAIIRIMDFAAARKLRLGDAIVDKIEYNKGRPFLHGKRF